MILAERTQTQNEQHGFSMPNAALTFYDFCPGDVRRFQSGERVLLISVFSGTVEYDFDLDDVSQTSRTLMLLSPYTSSGIHAFTKARLMALEINHSLLWSISRHFSSLRLPAAPLNPQKTWITIPLDQAMFAGIQQINGETVQHAEDPYLVELALRGFLYNLMQAGYARYLFPSSPSHPIEQVRYYIKQHITDCIRISELADMAGMNSSNFTNTFKRRFGQTPQEYIQRHKMAHAEKLLADHLVTDAAFAVGYENVSTFIAHFKKMYRMTPKQYQLSRHPDKAMVS